MISINKPEKFINKLIVLEGEDHSTKTTIGNQLNYILNDHGINSIYTFQPGGNWDKELAPQFRAYCKDKKYNFDDLTILFLFLADRSEHTKKLIIPSLDEGKTVICDRYWFSTIAFQFWGNELLFKYTMNEDFAYWMNRLASHYCTPDYSLLINREQSEIQKVKNDVNDIYETKDSSFKKRVHDGYQQLVNDGLLNKVNIIENDIEGTVQKVINFIEEK